MRHSASMCWHRQIDKGSFSDDSLTSDLMLCHLLLTRMISMKRHKHSVVFVYVFIGVSTFGGLYEGHNSRCVPVMSFSQRESASLNCVMYRISLWFSWVLYQQLRLSNLILQVEIWFIRAHLKFMLRLHIHVQSLSIQIGMEYDCSPPPPPPPPPPHLPESF